MAAKSALSRREFLGRTVATATTLRASAILAGSTLACAARTKVVRGACHHDCPDTCAWLATVEKGKVVRFEGDPDHPMTRGTLCARMSGYPDDVTFNPDRLLYPLRRAGGKGEGRFERVSWDEALGEVADRLRRIIAEHGPTAVLPYSYAGTEGFVQNDALSGRFFARMGASRLERNICGSAGHEGVKATIGTSTALRPADLVHSRLIVIWGANPAITNEHGWPFVLEAKRKGARVVVIDPLRSLTAGQADQHLRPLPGTDAALALGLMHVIVREGLHDADYVERYTVGFDRLRPRLAEYPPQRVARITGLPAADIEELARTYAKTKPAVIRTLIGMEHHANGAMTFRALSCLPALVGAWREQGGGWLQFTSGLFDGVLNRRDFDVAERIEDQTVRSINMVRLGQALTDPKLAPPIHALFVYNSNPATIAPNQNLVFQGLRRGDLLTVVLEQFLTDTARFADYVFPATSQLEHLDLLGSWGHEYLSLNLPAMPPQGETAPNAEFFRRLARRMGYEEPYLYESDEEMVKTLLRSNHPYLRGITYEQLRERGWVRLALPEPWIPFAEGNFPTPSRKCEFFSEALAAKGLDPLPTYVPVAAAPRDGARAYPLALLTSKSTLHFNNSSHGGEPRQRKAEGEPRLLMHAQDASPRNIRDGDGVRIFNERGLVTMKARVREDARPGVVSFPHGYWASVLPGGSSGNALTPDGLSDLGGGGDFLDARVEVERAPA